jgi:hypothetical protein
MYCPYCAAVLDAGQPACTRCGRPVPTAAPTPTAPPPLSAVADARPSSIRLAAVLLFIAWGVSLLSLASIVLRPAIVTRMAPGVLARIVGLSVLWLALPILIWQRQNWARVVVPLLLAWSIGTLMISILRIGGSVFLVVTFVIPVLVNALRVAAAVLLFKADSNDWFKRP